MSDSRKNIKCSPETFDFLSTIRDDHDLDWDTFLQQAGEAFLELVADEDYELQDALTLEDIADLIAREHDHTRSDIPSETARTIEERLQ